MKVGITELQEGAEVLLQFGITIQQVAQQAMNENGQKSFEIFWQGEKEVHCQLVQIGSATGRRSRVGKKISRHMSGIQTLN